MVRKVLTALLIVTALSGTASFEVLVPRSSTPLADGTGVPKCC